MIIIVAYGSSVRAMDNGGSRKSMEQWRQEPVSFERSQAILRLRFAQARLTNCAAVEKFKFHVNGLRNVFGVTPSSQDLLNEDEFIASVIPVMPELQEESEELLLERSKPHSFERSYNINKLRFAQRVTINEYAIESFKGRMNGFTKRILCGFIRPGFI